MGFLLGATLYAQDALPTPKHAPTPPVQIIRGDLQVTSVAPLGDILLTAPRPGEIHGPENDFAVTTRTDYVPGVTILSLLADDGTVLGFSREGDIYRTEDGVEWELETSLEGDASGVFARAPEEPHFLARTRIVDEFVYWEKRPGQTWEVLPTPALNHSNVEVVWHQGVWHFFDGEQIMRLDEGVFSPPLPLPLEDRFWGSLHVWKGQLLLDGPGRFVSADGENWEMIENSMFFCCDFLGVAGDQVFTKLAQGVGIGGPDTGWTLQNLPMVTDRGLSSYFTFPKWVLAWRDHYIVVSKETLFFISVDAVGESVTTRRLPSHFGTIATTKDEIVVSTYNGMARAPLLANGSPWALRGIQSFPGTNRQIGADTWSPGLFHQERLLVIAQPWGPQLGVYVWKPARPSRLYVFDSNGDAVTTNFPEDFHTEAVDRLGSRLLARGQWIGADDAETPGMLWSEDGLQWIAPPDPEGAPVRVAGSVFHVNGRSYRHEANQLWSLAPDAPTTQVATVPWFNGAIMSNGDAAFAMGRSSTGDRRTYLYRSEDGLTWTPVADLEADRTDIQLWRQLLTVKESAIIGRADHTDIYFTPDGEHWFTITLPFSPRQAVVTNEEVFFQENGKLAAMPLPRLVFTEAEPLGEGWVRSDWYGALWQHPDEDNHWLWHPAFGWQWIDPLQLDTGFWAWDHAEG